MRDPLSVAYDRFLKRVAPLTRQKSRGEGPTDYATAVADIRPDLAHEIQRITRFYVRLRYEAEPTRVEVAELQRMVVAFRPS